MSPPGSASRRLAVVLSHPTQYYSPWFQWIRLNTALEFRVFYLWNFGVTAQRDPKFGTVVRWDVGLLDGYESEFVPNRSRRPGPERFLGFDNPELASRLQAWGPGAVLLFGYKWLTHVRTILWARRRGVPILFRGDSHLIGRPEPRGLQRLVLRRLFAGMDAFLNTGAANRDYFRAFGVPERKLFFTPHAVNDRLFNPLDSRHRAGAAALRRDLGLDGKACVILFAGKLIPDKQPRELLQAFVAQKRDDCALVFVGEGEEKPALQAVAGAAPEAAVRFLPFANQSEMPSRYLLADLFALPSRGLYETWGLAVNEAMHMGLPALVSDRVGCQRDLVTEGETGWVFRAGEPGDLKARLGDALSAMCSPPRRACVRSSVADRISRYTYPRATEGLQAALASLDR